jgi:hypothetical protein
MQGEILANVFSQGCFGDSQSKLPKSVPTIAIDQPDCQFSRFVLMDRGQQVKNGPPTRRRDERARSRTDGGCLPCAIRANPAVRSACETRNPHPEKYNEHAF